MTAKELQEMIEASLLRNLSMVHRWPLRTIAAGNVVWIEDIEAMLKASAANLAVVVEELIQQAREDTKRELK